MYFSLDTIKFDSNQQLHTATWPFTATENLQLNLSLYRKHVFSTRLPRGEDGKISKERTIKSEIFLSFTRNDSFFFPQNNPISSLCLYWESRENAPKLFNEGMRKKKVVWYQLRSIQKTIKIMCGACKKREGEILELEPILISKFFLINNINWFFKIFVE